MWRKKRVYVRYVVRYVNLLQRFVRAWSCPPNKHNAIVKRNCEKRKNNGNNGIKAMWNVMPYQWATHLPDNLWDSAVQPLSYNIHSTLETNAVRNYLECENLFSNKCLYKIQKNTHSLCGIRDSSCFRLRCMCAVSSLWADLASRIGHQIYQQHIQRTHKRWKSRAQNIAHIHTQYVIVSM